MSEFDYVNATQPQKEEHFRAQLNALPLAEEIADRLALVAGNLVVASEKMILDVAATSDGPEELAAYIKSLDRNITFTQRDAENARAKIHYSPLHYSAVGLQRMRLLLNNYTPHAPAIFGGYTPVSSDPDWAVRLRVEDVSRFGRRDERLILLAGTMAAEGVFTCRTYSELHEEGLRRGSIRVA